MESMHRTGTTDLAHKDRDPLAYRGRRPAPTVAPAPAPRPVRQPSAATIDRQVAKALRALDVAMVDARFDYPEVDDVDLYPAMVDAVALDLHPATARAFRRATLGY